MKQELKDKWIAALRSGDYIQGRGWLKYQDTDGVNKWCCLGVLADVTDNTKWSVFDPISTPRSPTEGRIYYQYDKPPDEGEFQKFGATSLYAVGLGGDQPWLLATMNDGASHVASIEPMSFLGIADWIEKHIEVEDESGTTRPMGRDDECGFSAVVVEETV